MLVGCRYGFGGGTPTGPNIDAFDPVKNSWDPQVTWPAIPTGQGFGVLSDAAGNVFTQTGARLSTTAKTWDNSYATASVNVRYPWAIDTLRGQAFGLCWGDGEGYWTPQINAVAYPIAGGATRTITFNASLALAAFQSDGPTYAAIDYSLNHWRGLSRFLLDGAVPIDNNHIENQIRPWALGRRNWLSKNR